MWQLLVLAFRGLPFSVHLAMDEANFREVIKPNSLIRAPFQQPPKIAVVVANETITSFVLHISPLAFLKPIYKGTLDFRESDVAIEGRFTLGGAVRLLLYLGLLGALTYECISVARFVRAADELLTFDHLLGFALGLFVAPLALLIVLSIAAQVLSHYREDMQSIVHYFTKLQIQKGSAS